MRKVLTAAQMREVDRLTTERYGIPSIILMENAAHAVARVITEKLGGTVNEKSILILCGKGNNGGDGAALARILWTQGANCFVYLLGRIEETKGDAQVNFELINKISESDDANWPNDNCLYLSEMRTDIIDNFIYQWKERDRDCFVDALFGTGVTRPVEGEYKSIIDSLSSIRRHPGTKLIVSIDMPSGLDSDMEYPIGSAVCADVTVTFTAPKLSNVLLPAARNNGEVIVTNIGSVAGLIEDQPSQLFLAEENDTARWLRNSRFTDDSYKNKRGHAVLIAGSENYSGAAVLAGNAAMRSGVGLVTLASPKESKAEIASRLLPEVILTSIDANSASPEFVSKADAIAVGCGIDADDPAIEQVVRNVVENRTVPVIVDAGALWFFNPPNGLLQKPFRVSSPHISKGSIDDEQDSRLSTWTPADAGGSHLILTPHEGEFLRLLGTADKDAIKDRVQAVRDFATKHDVILVLKGERVLIGAPNGNVVVNPTGNSGLGKAGNGDTLTGILVGFIAQAVQMKIDIFETAVAAVYVAGMAGDAAERKYGKRVMTASDVRECLTEVFAQFEKAD